MINVYTDGACINNGKSNALSGYGIYFGVNDARNESKKVEGDKHSNNIAELTAFIRALEILQEEIIKDEQVNLYTDSEYVIKCATTYGDKLDKKNWIFDKEPPNLNLVKKAYTYFKNLPNVNLIHIEAHTNKDDIHSKGNAKADELANMAIGIKNTDNNKVYINIAFENKDAAKLLGAKWDLKNKKWFYYNNISDENKEKLKNLEEKKVTQIVIPKNYLNINYAKKNIAKSYGAKWDIVEKKWYYLDTLDEINKQKLKEL